MELSPRCKEWGDLMKGMCEPAPEAKEGEFWIGKFIFKFHFSPRIFPFLLFQINQFC